MMIETDLFDYIWDNALQCIDKDCPSCGNLLKSVEKLGDREILICEGCYYVNVYHAYEGSTYYKLTRKQLDHIKKNFYKDE